MSDDKTPCPRTVTHLRYWPGSEPDYVCKEHADDTRTIGEALGHHIPLVEIAIEADNDIKCACSEGRLQRIRMS